MKGDILRPLSLALLLFCAGMFSGCTQNMPGSPQTKTGYYFDQETFNREKALWESQNLEAYQYKHFYVGNHVGEYYAEISVKPEGSSVKNISRWGPEEDDPDYEWWLELVAERCGEPGISGLYEWLGSEASGYKESHNAPGSLVEITVEYDEFFHFPKKIRMYLRDGPYVPNSPPGAVAINVKISDFEVD